MTRKQNKGMSAVGVEEPDAGRSVFNGSAETSSSASGSDCDVDAGAPNWKNKVSEGGTAGHSSKPPPGVPHQMGDLQGILIDEFSSSEQMSSATEDEQIATPVKKSADRESREPASMVEQEKDGTNAATIYKSPCSARDIGADLINSSPVSTLPRNPVVSSSSARHPDSSRPGHQNTARNGKKPRKKARNKNRASRNTKVDHGEKVAKRRCASVGLLRFIIGLFLLLIVFALVTVCVLYYSEDGGNVEQLVSLFAIDFLNTQLSSLFFSKTTSSHEAADGVVPECNQGRDCTSAHKESRPRRQLSSRDPGEADLNPNGADGSGTVSSKKREAANAPFLADEGEQEPGAGYDFLEEQPDDPEPAGGKTSMTTTTNDGSEETVAQEPAGREVDNGIMRNMKQPRPQRDSLRRMEDPVDYDEEERDSDEEFLQEMDDPDEDENFLQHQDFEELHRNTTEFESAFASSFLLAGIHSRPASPVAHALDAGRTEERNSLRSSAGTSNDEPVLQPDRPNNGMALAFPSPATADLERGFIRVEEGRGDVSGAVDTPGRRPLPTLATTGNAAHDFLQRSDSAAPGKPVVLLGREEGFSLSSKHGRLRPELGLRPGRMTDEQQSQAAADQQMIQLSSLKAWYRDHQYTKTTNADLAFDDVLATFRVYEQIMPEDPLRTYYFDQLQKNEQVNEEVLLDLVSNEKSGLGSHCPQRELAVISGDADRPKWSSEFAKEKEVQKFFLFLLQMDRISPSLQILQDAYADMVKAVLLSACGMWYGWHGSDRIADGNGNQIDEDQAVSRRVEEMMENPQEQHLKKEPKTHESLYRSVSAVLQFYTQGDVYFAEALIWDAFLSFLEEPPGAGLPKSKYDVLSLLLEDKTDRKSILNTVAQRHFRWAIGIDDEVRNNENLPLGLPLSLKPASLLLAYGGSVAEQPVEAWRKMLQSQLRGEYVTKLQEVMNQVLSIEPEGYLE
ncbi:unnamed protein product [Amoebophrya sp. A120]|nr:unnamed protein product [Amoebophrya sp. A120]|eukprot:GSA120T00016596001.1